jgi:hypothetical protein
MTLRDYLTKRKARMAYWSIASLIIMVLALVAAMLLERSWVNAIAFVALASYLISIFFYRFRIRCPRCNGNIGLHTNYFGLRKSLFFDTVYYCPFCGVHVDEPLAPNNLSSPKPHHS